MLTALGFSGSINSADIKLYGNGAANLPEDNAVERADDLIENPLEIVDGGDGIFDGNDFLIFYAQGPHIWRYEAASSFFLFEKNWYTDTAFYFITLASSTPSKRIATALPSPPPSVFIDSYTDLFAHELNTTNLLNSGKVWVGEPFSTGFGGTATRLFNFSIPNRLPLKPIQIFTHFTNRSVGSKANFSVLLNDIVLQNSTLNEVSGLPLNAFATELSTRTLATSSTPDIALRFSYSSAAVGAQAWLNQFTLAVERSLRFVNDAALIFRTAEAFAAPTTASFSIGNANNNCAVWNVSQPLLPVKMSTQWTSNSIQFSQHINSVQTYIAFHPKQLLAPLILGNISNQNIHNSVAVNGLIICPPAFMAEAQRLADFHASVYGLKDAVLSTQAIYNEFGSGIADPVAIRDCIKMYAEKYAHTRPNLQYILLFGAGSFDPKNRIANNTHLIPTYQSNNSLNPLISYTSDDFFVLTNASDNINALNNTPMSLAIGRLPVTNTAEAALMVDKIIRYHQPAAQGSWRNELVLLADDGDQNLHFNSAELLAATTAKVNPSIHTNKIFLDAFPLVSGAGGARFPAVNNAIVNQIFKGALLFNYTGHGNYARLAQEAVLSNTELNLFNNADKLPLFVTASCDFAPHDDASKKSLGTALLLNSPNGAIGLVSTTRLVFASSNNTLNNHFFEAVLARNSSGSFPSLGQSVLLAKNKTLQNNGDVLNCRKFALLGDPAMQLGFAKLNMQLDSLNGQLFTANDSLLSLQPYHLVGSITEQGILQANFNGNALIQIYDKPIMETTLGNTPASIQTQFATENQLLFNGNTQVVNGKFSTTLLLPKTLSSQKGMGTIRLYANTRAESPLLRDAAGVLPIAISGNAKAASGDKIGPEIKIFLNDSLFKNGGLSAENPVLLVHFFDSSGINATGNSIGRDLLLIIDGDERNSVVLNAFYHAELGGFLNGNLRYQLPSFSAGKHSITLKAWDMANNSNTATLHFEVMPQSLLKISSVKNFPNPFSNQTVFEFEHNQPNTPLKVEVQIYNSKGAWVKSITESVKTIGTRNLQIKWTGTDNFGRKLTRGMYFYRIIVSAAAQKVQYAGKLLLL